MIDIYGTIGPACASKNILIQMFQEGMTGIRLNTSHVSLKEAKGQIALIQEAAMACNIIPKLLIDMQGPELRLGKFTSITLHEDDIVKLISFKEMRQEEYDIPVPELVLGSLFQGVSVLLDDGKILLEMKDAKYAVVKRGGILKASKSIAIPGVEINPPAMTDQDIMNIKEAVSFGVTGVMQPFVRNADDLKQVRKVLDDNGGKHIRLLAKIENISGVKNLNSFFPYADEIVIARGDLGNAMPLWELPRTQKQIARQCKKNGMPFMVVTQMLASMEQNAVPTRAEVSDIYNAICDGASSVMVTGETAAGKYPVEVIRYLSKTVITFDGNN